MQELDVQNQTEGVLSYRTWVCYSLLPIVYDIKLQRVSNPLSIIITEFSHNVHTCFIVICNIQCMRQTICKSILRIVENLSYCTLFTFLCALPICFFINDQNSQSYLTKLAISLNLLFFIGLFTILTSLTVFRTLKQLPLVARSLWIGITLRSGISVISFAFFFLNKSMFNLNGDFIEWVFAIATFSSLIEAFLAWNFVDTLGRSWPLIDMRTSILGDSPHERSQDIWIGDMDSFFPTLATLGVTGILITCSVLVLSLLSFCVLLFLEKKKAS